MQGEGMREKVARAYDADTWRNRVMHLMPDNQVIAIYHNMIERRTLPRKKPKKKGQVQYEQLSMFDMI